MDNSTPVTRSAPVVRMVIALKSGTLLEFRNVSEKDAEKVSRAFEFYNQDDEIASRKFQLDNPAPDTGSRYVVIHLPSIETLYVERMTEMFDPSLPAGLSI